MQLVSLLKNWVLSLFKIELVICVSAFVPVYVAQQHLISLIYNDFNGHLAEGKMGLEMLLAL